MSIIGSPCGFQSLLITVMNEQFEMFPDQYRMNSVSKHNRYFFLANNCSKPLQHPANYKELSYLNTVTQDVVNRHGKLNHCSGP